MPPTNGEPRTRTTQVLEVLSDRYTHELLDHDILTAVYLRAMQMPQVTGDDLQDAGCPHDVQRCLLMLEQMHLLTKVDDHAWTATPPEPALSRRAGRLEQEARVLRAAAPAIGRMYFEALARHDPSATIPGLELLTSLEQVNVATSRLLAEADRTLTAMCTTSPRVLHILAQDPVEAETAWSSSKGDRLLLRLAFDQRLLEEDGRTRGFLDARATAGDEIRVAGTLPFTALSADTGGVVIDLHGTETEVVGLRITHPDLARAITTVVDGCWARGVPWAGAIPAPTALALDRRDHDILALMLTGAADATIARQLRVSQRTVERRVSRIMELLGASTRFQAGAHAARRGWL